MTAFQSYPAGGFDRRTANPSTINQCGPAGDALQKNDRPSSRSAFKCLDCGVSRAIAYLPKRAAYATRCSMIHPEGGRLASTINGEEYDPCSQANRLANCGTQVTSSRMNRRPSGPPSSAAIIDDRVATMRSISVSGAPRRPRSVAGERAGTSSLPGRGARSARIGTYGGLL